MNKQQREQVKAILESLGYKEYRAGDEYYFLPNRRQIKFTKKLTEQRIQELFEPLFAKTKGKQEKTEEAKE